MFLDMIFESLWRHKTRSFLTTLGIIIAIAAIVSLGSISEGISKLVDQQLKLASNFIIVTEEGGFDMNGGGVPGTTSRIDREKIEEIRQIDGVKEAVPQIKAMSTKNNLFVVGMPLDSLEFFDLENIEFVEGGWPEENEDSAAIGYQISEVKGLKTGDEIEIENDEYVVSGVLEEMSNFMDYGVITSVDAAAETFDFEDQVSAIIVEPEDIKDSKGIKNEIEDTFDGLDAITGEEAIERAREAIDQVRLITLGIGIIASLVASIGIINTMVMMVFERKKEFGVMKALGAKRITILTLVMQEAIFLGIIGSVIGIGIGYFGTDLINQTSGFPIAAVTAELVVVSLIYGILLCVFAAAYPAYNAINIDPVDAMREQ